MTILLNQTTIRIVQADITTLAVDAIVNAANSQLWMGGGVAGAIKRAGGEEIEREAVARGPIEVGEAILTSGGRLPARFVIHAATMGADLVTGEDAIRRSTRAALSRAREQRLTSIAVPAMGTGVGGFPLDLAAEVMVQEIAAHVAEGTTLREVVLAVRGREAEQAFSWVLGRYKHPAI